MARTKSATTAAKTTPRPAVASANAQASMSANTASNTKSAAKSGKRSQNDINQIIAERAFLIFERRGSAHGRHQEDWIEAEKQIRRELRIS